MVAVGFPVISTAGRNLRSLTFVRDDNAVSCKHILSLGVQTGDKGKVKGQP